MTPEGWELFAKDIKKAEATLIESESYASHNLLWHALFIKNAVASDYTEAQFARVVDKAIARQSDYFDYYNSAVTHYLPKWGGSFEQVDAFATKEVKATRASEGDGTYARAYLYIGDQSRENVFTETLASWPRMKASFDALVKKYGGNMRHLNQYAAMACLANDAQTYTALRERIGTDIIPALWKFNYQVDVCDPRLLKH